MHLILAITTYKREKYLNELLNSFYKYTDFTNNHWRVIVHNDELSTLNIDSNIIQLQSDRKGVHVGTNKLLKEASKYNFDAGFKCDDDIMFLNHGWEKAYLKGMVQYQHLSYYNAALREGVIKKICGNFQYYTDVFRSQGAMWTFTPEVLQKVGYFDVENMGFRGIGHINYSYRCCLAGFNRSETFFDIYNSEKYIGMHENYFASLPHDEILKYRKDQTKKIQLTKELKQVYGNYQD